MSAKVKALYGFSPNLPPFAGRTPAEQVALLQSWGCTAIFGGYQDPAFVAAAQTAGLKLYAEFSCFVGAEWWEKFPASRPVTAEGRPLENEDWYYGVNPTAPPVRQARLEALAQLLTGYPLDGVWLDFIRWPCHWEAPDPERPQTSFDPATLARFSQESGLPIPLGEIPAVARFLLDRHEAAWTGWRCWQITTWVAQARAVLERVRPGALLGLFGVPWRLADYDGAILKIIGQDYQALGPYLDVFSPMVYHRMCGQPPAWIGQVAAEIHALSGKPVWPIIQSIDRPDPLPVEEYAQALDAAQADPAEGVLVFTLEGVVRDEARLAVTRARFNQ